MSPVAEAMQNLLLPQYSSIRDVFGNVLTKRSKQPQPSCALLSLLENKAWPLELLNEDCAIYIREIGLADARKKCHGDVLGNVGRPWREFNGACGDFWAEMSAIRVLVTKGYNRFRAIHKQQPDGSTNDYEAYLGDSPAHVEVKNMRANKTVTDFFDREIRCLHESDPAKFDFDIIVDFPYDNPPSGEQERRIRAFLEPLRGRKPPFREDLDLVDAVARINVIAGDGRARMIRGMGPDSPEPVDKERFLGKIRDKAVEALGQMKNEQRLKVLVINFDSPSGSISEDFIRDGENEIRGVFNGAVDPYVLLYRHHIQAGN